MVYRESAKLLMNIQKQSELIKKSNWDTIIILDACRYDIFKEVNTINGELLTVNSGAFNTSSWYKKHWNKENAKDVILISAQPMIWWIDVDKNFYDAYLMMREDDNWMHPKFTIDKALELDDCDQKLLVHLIPPHLPFQGESGKKFIEKIGGKDEGEKLWDVKLGVNHLEKRIIEYGIENGWDELKCCYKENLEFALLEVKRYCMNTLRRVIITADHGEFIGENNMYGHSQSNPLLTQVPWIERI